MRTSNVRMRVLTIAAALALAVLTAACGGGGEDDGAGAGGGSEASSEAGGGGGGSAAIQTKDFALEPAEPGVAPGAGTVAIHNTGEAPPTLTIEELDVNEEVQAGEQGTAEFEAEPGEYEFVCTFHAENMTGTLTVTE